ncbi:MAG: DUF4031 domain-containing protein [Planctomycetota bacterium]|jgi:hypothetical protein
MTVYVDRLRTYSEDWYSNEQAARNGRRHGHQWCHLYADTPEELVKFAKRLGLREEWMHRSRRFSHFDLVPTKRAKAVKMGAVEKEINEERIASQGELWS